MSDVTVYPVSYAISGTPNTVNPAVTVGPDPWQAPDATYTETWRTTRASGPPFYMLDQASGTWAAYSGTVDDVVPFARIETLQANTTLTSTDAQIEMNDTSTTGSPFVGWFRPYNTAGTLPSANTIYEIAGTDWRWEDEFGGTSKARLISVLQAGNLKAIVHVPQLPGGWTTASMAWGVRVHQFGLVVSSRPTNPAPLRLYPRSSTRLYPRRRTRRPGTF